MKKGKKGGFGKKRKEERRAKLVCALPFWQSRNGGVGGGKKKGKGWGKGKKKKKEKEDPRSPDNSEREKKGKRRKKKGKRGKDAFLCVSIGPQTGKKGIQKRKGGGGKEGRSTVFAPSHQTLN